MTTHHSTQKKLQHFMSDLDQKSFKCPKKLYFLYLLNASVTELSNCSLIEQNDGRNHLTIVYIILDLYSVVT